MAVEAFENGLAPQFVAGGTVRGAFKVIVCASKWSGRYLGLGLSEHKQEDAECEQCGAHGQSDHLYRSNWQSFRTLLPVPVSDAGGGCNG